MSLQAALIANAALDLLVIAALTAVFRPAFSVPARKAPRVARRRALHAATLANPVSEEWAA
jgi:hypothetical protein